MSVPKPPKGTQATPAPAGRAVAVQPVSNGGIATFSGGLLAQLATHAKDVAATEKVQSGAMSLRAGVMQWQGKPVPGNRMQVIVLASSYENMYYPKAFDPNNISSPVCFAQSLQDGDLTPHENSVDKQHETCKGCWAHEWSSDPKGGRGKACKQVRKLALIPAYEDEEEIATAEMATLRVPVMSVKNWSGYASERATVDGLPYFVFNTEISVVPDPRSQFQVHFNKVGVLPNENVVAAVMARRAQADQLLLTPYEPAKEEDEEEQKPAAGRKPAKY
jgi:hypothetical protein